MEREAQTMSAGEMLVEGFRHRVSIRPEPARQVVLDAHLSRQTLGGLMDAALAAESLEASQPLADVTPEQTMRVAMRFMDLAATAATEQAELRYLNEELAARATKTLCRSM